MKAKSSVKISGDVILFLKKFRTNRRKVDVDDEDLSYSRLLSVITKYFKNNNEEYLKIVGMPEDKNV